MKFIGHLDIMRYFQKALRRAGYDMVYSKGFHPHPVMSFASPLGLGLESLGEYMDIETASALPMDQMQENLDEQMAEGMKILKVVRLDDGAKNSMSIFAGADYRVSFRQGFREADQPESEPRLFSRDQVSTFLAADSILVRKKTKKSEIDLDIRPLIFDMVLEDGGTLFMSLSAGSAANLKPELVVRAMCSTFSLAYDPYQLLITRLEMYADQGKDGRRDLVPLDRYQIWQGEKQEDP